jgi:hypothetical protein
LSWANNGQSTSLATGPRRHFLRWARQARVAFTGTRGARGRTWGQWFLGAANSRAGSLESRPGGTGCRLGPRRVVAVRLCRGAAQPAQMATSRYRAGFTSLGAAKAVPWRFMEGQEQARNALASCVAGARPTLHTRVRCVVSKPWPGQCKCASPRAHWPTTLARLGESMPRTPPGSLSL